MLGRQRALPSEILELLITATNNSGIGLLLRYCVVCDFRTEVSKVAHAFLYCIIILE